jgi:hypothetical protein
VESRERVEEQLELRAGAAADLEQAVAVRVREGASTRACTRSRARSSSV